MFFARAWLAASTFGMLALVGLAASDANAQQIFRIVGPDGRVTFSDQPPLDAGARGSAAKTFSVPGTGGGDSSALPFELRQAASRYPVTLYTGPDCAPCVAGRTMLSTRGIPFTEKTVTNNNDIEALRRLAGATPLPFLTIGGQQLKGYSEAEWEQFLDAAGYPKSSQLPPGYVQRPAAPLVAAQEPQLPKLPPAPSPSAAGPTPEPATAESPGDNPAGIRF